MTRPTLLLFFLFVTACTSPDVGECPADLDLLAPVLTELHLAEALAKEVPPQLKDSIEEVYYAKVLADHRLSREDFDSLMWIVRQEPVWVDSLYTRVGVTLARMETEL